MAAGIVDLRTALEFLETVPGQLVSTDVAVDPYLELAGVYRRVGAGTPTAPPTRIGPAMLFDNVKGSTWRSWPACSPAGSVRRSCSARRPSGWPSTCSPRSSGRSLRWSSPAGQAPCQEVVLRPPFDLRTAPPRDDEHAATPAPSSTWLSSAPRIPRPASPTSPSTACASRSRHDERELHGPARHIDVFLAKAGRGQAAAGLREHRPRSRRSTWPPRSRRPRRRSASTSSPSPAACAAARSSWSTA